MSPATVAAKPLAPRSPLAVLQRTRTGSTPMSLLHSHAALLWGVPPARSLLFGGLLSHTVRVFGCKPAHFSASHTSSKRRFIQWLGWGS
jgi:hypothetical protein